METEIKIKSSIAQKLLTYVFSIYFIVTIFATSVHLYTDFNAAGYRIRSQLTNAASLVEPSLADSLWNYNSEAIQAVLTQIAKESVTLGAIVQDDQGNVWRAGEVPADDQGNFIAYDKLTGVPQSEAHFVPKTFAISQELFYTDAAGKEQKIGQLEIYSSSGIVLNDVKGVFYLILVNAVLKSLALWFLFTYFCQLYLTQPMKKLTETTQQVAKGFLNGASMSQDTTWPTEIDVLIANFNKMTGDLRSHQEKIATIQARLSDIIDSMPSMIMGITPQGLITDWNNEIEKFTGVNLNDALNKEFIDFMPSYDFMLPLIAKVVENKIDETLTSHMVFFKQRRFYQDIVLYPILNKMGGVETIIIKIDDVTQRINLERSMVQTEKMSSLGTLAAGMAHEINTPLGNILQASENITRRIDPAIEANQKVANELDLDLTKLQNYLDNRKITTFLTTIKDSADKAIKTLAGLIDFSTQSNAAKAPCHFEDIIDKAFNLANSDYDLKQNTDFTKIQIVRDYQQNLPKVHAVAGDIHQVILNILKVSCQSMNQQSKSPTVTLKLRRQDNMVYFELIDNGPGLTVNEIKKLFEPFFIPKSGDPITVGLAVSQRIVEENHKGTFTLKTAEQGGLLFEIGLPVAAEI